MSYVSSYNISMAVEGLNICTKRDAHVRGLQYVPSQNQFLKADIMSDMFQVINKRALRDAWSYLKTLPQR